MKARLVIDTPVGRLRLTEIDGALSAIDWADEAPPSDGKDVPIGPTALLRETERQLREYFAGNRRHFTLPLAAADTPFQQRMRAAMLAIPYGETRSYGALASALGSAPRAVGGACGRNPLAIVVPCHRVLAGGGPRGKATGGYSGGKGLATKQRLLELEGALLPGLLDAKPEGGG
jgi:methylated-DNA-[protein]-cysteine S-methyltransferase